MSETALTERRELGRLPITSAHKAHSSGVAGLLFACALCAALGAGWSVSQGYLLCTIALPVLVMRQPDRPRANAVAIAYFLAAGADILRVGPYLATTESSAIPLASFWLSAALLQSLIWRWCWEKNVRFGRTALALILSVVPPFGFIGWAHPLHTAGLLFPALGLTGIILTLALIDAAAAKPELLSLVLSVATLSHIEDQPPKAIPWSGFNTNYGDVFRGDDPLAVMDAVARSVREDPSVVQVWPESVVPHWNEATEAWWGEAIADARKRGKTIVFGSTIGIPDPEFLRLRNVAVIQGREDRPPVDQGTPILGATWHPITGSGVPLNLFRSPMRELAGERAAFLICYEQLLGWSYISLLRDRPTVLVGMANTFWVGGTSIPRVQSACLYAWARLFHIPVVEAVNR